MKTSATLNRLKNRGLTERQIYAMRLNFEIFFRTGVCGSTHLKDMEKNSSLAQQTQTIEWKKQQH